MSGFEAWAASFHGTEVIAACTLALGMILGWLWATRPRHLTRRERRELADRAERRVLRAQMRWLRQLRETRGGTVMPPVTLTNSFEGGHGQVGIPPEWEPAHVGAALAVANGDPITTGEIRAITEDMDVFMARLLGEHPVPYPDGSGK